MPHTKQENINNALKGAIARNQMYISTKGRQGALDKLSNYNEILRDAIVVYKENRTPIHQPYEDQTIKAELYVALYLKMNRLSTLSSALQSAQNADPKKLPMVAKQAKRLKIKRKALWQVLCQDEALVEKAVLESVTQALSSKKQPFPSLRDQQNTALLMHIAIHPSSSLEVLSMIADHQNTCDAVRNKIKMHANFPQTSNPDLTASPISTIDSQSPKAAPDAAIAPLPAPIPAPIPAPSASASVQPSRHSFFYRLRTLCFQDTTAQPSPATRFQI